VLPTPPRAGETALVL